MNEREIRTLLQKYIDEDITAGEKERFLNLVSSPENESTFKKIFYSLLEEIGEDTVTARKADFDRIFQRILSETDLFGKGQTSENISLYRSVKRKKIVSRISIAAVLVIAFSMGILVDSYIKKVAPEESSEVTFTEVTSPYGSISRIELPDGSQVQLNAGSTLKYQSNYNVDNRDLSLKGEAYFKVAKNADLPLNVSVGNLTVRAIGTEFNIKGYEDESIIETTLIEGKIEIYQTGKSENENRFVDLNPNQKAIFNRGTSDFTLEAAVENKPPEAIPYQKSTNNIMITPKVDVNQVTAWTEGKLVIRGEYLEDICVKLQRKYDVTFIFGDEETKKYRFSGILLDETLEQVLDAMKSTAPIDYSLSGKSVFLSTNIKASGDFSKHLK